MGSGRGQQRRTQAAERKTKWPLILLTAEEADTLRGIIDEYGELGADEELIEETMQIFKGKGAETWTQPATIEANQETIAIIGDMAQALDDMEAYTDEERENVQKTLDRIDAAAKDGNKRRKRRKVRPEVNRVQF